MVHFSREHTSSYDSYNESDCESHELLPITHTNGFFFRKGDDGRYPFQHDSQKEFRALLRNVSENQKDELKHNANHKNCCFNWILIFSIIIFGGGLSLIGWNIAALQGTGESKPEFIFWIGGGVGVFLGIFFIICISCIYRGHKDVGVFVRYSV